ncbi:MAG: tetratricopeptide repeat protein, partial [Ktedonobacterales bacterium]
PQGETEQELAAVARQLLGGRDALVVLDNIEPYVSELVHLVAPLREAGAILLLTARHDLPAAAVPPGASRRLDVLAPDEAQALFARLLVATRTLVLTDDEILHVQRIVQTLGYHTLAVRLAAVYAARRPYLAALADELERDPLKSPNDETPRGVALVLGRSVEALPDDARILFAALAAFATNDFGRQAALSVAAQLGVGDPDAAVDTLVRNALLDTALDATLPEGSDRERLRLHPLLRAYAAEQFGKQAEQERETTYQAIATHYARYVEHISDSGITDLVLVSDETNLNDALERAHTSGEDDTVANLCDGLRQFWRDHGRTKEALAYLPWGIAAADLMASQTSDPVTRLRAARIERGYGDILSNVGRLDEAEAIFQRNLRIRRSLEDRRGEGVDLSSLGQIALSRGRLDEADSFFQQSLVIDREVQDRRGEGVDLYELALIAEAIGDLDQAETLHRQSLDIAIEVQAGQDIADSYAYLGEFLIKRGKRGDGCRMLADAARLYDQMDIPGAEQTRERARELGCH